MSDGIILACVAVFGNRESGNKLSYRLRKIWAGIASLHEN